MIDLQYPMSMDRFMTELNGALDKETGIRNTYRKFCGKMTLEQIFTTESVYLAARRCASGFQNRKDTFYFMQSAWLNSMNLCSRVCAGKFRPEYYPERAIVERGKKRIIKPPKFETKIVQKILCDYLLRPILEPKMIGHNYASVKKRGTAEMHKLVLKEINNLKPGSVIVTTDFSGYFGNIDNELLRKNVYERFIEDPRVVDLLCSFDPKDGLSLGNETAQIPASYFPSCVDHEMTDHLGVNPYHRYMDDILFAADCEDQARILLDHLQKGAEAIRLTMKPEKIHLIPFGEPFVFCKERYLFNRDQGYYYQMMNPRTIRHAKVRIHTMGKKVLSGEISASDFRNQYLTARGVLQGHPNTGKAVRRLAEIYSSYSRRVPG